MIVREEDYFLSLFFVLLKIDFDRDQQSFGSEYNLLITSVMDDEKEHGIKSKIYEDDNERQHRYSSSMTIQIKLWDLIEVITDRNLQWGLLRSRERFDFNHITCMFFSTQYRWSLQDHLTKEFHFELHTQSFVICLIWCTVRMRRLSV